MLAMGFGDKWHFRLRLVLDGVNLNLPGLTDYFLSNLLTRKLSTLVQLAYS